MSRGTNPLLNAFSTHPQPDILGWSGCSEAHTKDGGIGPSSPTVMALANSELAADRIK